MDSHYMNMAINQTRTYKELARINLLGLHAPTIEIRLHIPRQTRRDTVDLSCCQMNRHVLMHLPLPRVDDSGSYQDIRRLRTWQPWLFSDVVVWVWGVEVDGDVLQLFYLVRGVQADVCE